MNIYDDPYDRQTSVYLFHLIHTIAFTPPHIECKQEIKKIHNSVCVLKTERIDCDQYIFFNLWKTDNKSGILPGNCDAQTNAI